MRSSFWSSAPSSWVILPSSRWRLMPLKSSIATSTVEVELEAAAEAPGVEADPAGGGFASCRAAGRLPPLGRAGADDGEAGGA